MPTATETLRKIFKDIANAIRGKDGTTEAIDKIEPTDYARRIQAIQTGLDTSDATAAPSDISSGKIAYGAGGRITGTLPERNSITVSGVTPSGMQGDGLHISADVPSSSAGIIRAGATINVISPASYFGTATPSDVLLGRTFTSSNGLKISGSLTPGAGTDISDATARASDIMSGKTAYISSGKVTGSMPVAGSISGELGTTSEPNWSSSDPNRGSGTVSIRGVSQTPGYTPGFMDGSISVEIPANRLLKGRTVTPTTSTQTIVEAEDIAYGAIKVVGDANLKSTNIKKGVSIFGVSGTLSAGTDTSDATATADDIAETKTAYGPSGKITGKLADTLSLFGGLSSENMIYESRTLHMKSNPLTFSVILRKGGIFQLDAFVSQFGDATAADVASGKTFTSSAGFKVTGTGKLAKPDIDVKVVNNASVSIATMRIDAPRTGVHVGTVTSGRTSNISNLPAYGSFVIHELSYDDQPISISSIGKGLKSQPIPHSKTLDYYVVVIPGYSSSDYTITVTDG